MNRSLKLSVLLALALGSSQVAALELGQIQIKSALGQPLLAEIPVTPASPAELQDLSAQLASAQDAAQAGIAAAPSVPLQFTVADGANGKKVIRITSAAPVNDPYLDLLVQVDSSAGRSLREFTILLDPPAASAVAQGPATRAPVQSTGKAAKRAPVPAPAPAAPAAATSNVDATAAAPAPAPKPAARRAARVESAAATTAPAGSMGPVERGQTLSHLAVEATAGTGVSVNQMLLALKQANPDAFYRDNINALKSGAVLRVPSHDEAAALTAAAAAAEVLRQNNDWRSGNVRTGNTTVVADAATRANASTAPTTAATASDHLALIPAKDGSAKGSAGTGGNNDVQQDLLRSKEDLSALKQQGDELKSRLKDLSDINTKNDRLLALKDSEIADLQRKLAAARKKAGLPVDATPAATASTAVNALGKLGDAAAAAGAADVVVAKPAGASTAAVPPASSLASASSSAPAHAGSVAADAANKPVIAKHAPVKHVPPPPPPVQDDPWYMQVWAWAVGALVLVALALLALRKRGAGNDKSAPAFTGGGAKGNSLADRFGTASAPGGFSAADPDQDTLLDQLAEHPDNLDLHLELVSLYHGRRDVEHFEAAAEAMYAHIYDPQQPEWQMVVHMGQDLVPGHPLFAHPAPEFQHETSSHFGDGHDHDLDHEEDAFAAPALAAGQGSKVSEYNFDFDLTPRPGQAPAAAAPAPAPVHVEAPSPAPAPAPAANTGWHFAEPEEESAPAHAGDDDTHSPLGQFSDDPVDTKLDLARAYLDMGDPDGAKAMLEEVLHEGSKIQKEAAQKLLGGIR